MRKITEIFITVCEIPNSEMHELCVRAGDGYDDFYVTKGFDTIKECTMFAESLARGLGLDPETCIERDVNEGPHLTLVQ